MTANPILLSHLVRELAALAAAPLPSHVTYRRLYRDVLNGRLTTEVRRGRNYIQRERLPEIATTLGVTLRDELSSTPALPGASEVSAPRRAAISKRAVQSEPRNTTPEPDRARVTDAAA